MESVKIFSEKKVYRFFSPAKKFLRIFSEPSKLFWIFLKTSEGKKKFTDFFDWKNSKMKFVSPPLFYWNVFVRTTKLFSCRI